MTNRDSWTPALVLSLLIACGGESTDPPAVEPTTTRPEPTTPREPTVPATNPSSVRLVEVALPTSAPPFPGYAGRDRCTLIAPLPAATLGLPGPIFQCEMARYLTVALDGTTREVELRIGGASPDPRALHAATRGTYRDARAWLGTTLLRGSATGLDRWLPAAPPTAPDPAQAHSFAPIAGLEGQRVAKLVGGTSVAWAVAEDAIWRVTGAGADVRAERFFDLGELPRGGGGAATGDFCLLAPIDDERVMVRHRNYGRNDLFVVDETGATPLAVPARTSAPPAASPVPPGSLGGPPGGGGMAAPRTHDPLRVGDRVFVGSADDRLFVFDPAATALVDVSPPGLRPSDTRDLRPEYGAATEGVALLVVGNRLRSCAGGGPCETVDAPTDRNYAHVVHVRERTFLALYVGSGGTGGATLVTLP